MKESEIRGFQKFVHSNRFLQYRVSGVLANSVTTVLALLQTWPRSVWDVTPERLISAAVVHISPGKVQEDCGADV